MKQERPSQNLQEDSQDPIGQEILQKMKDLGLPMTKEAYLDLIYLGEVPEEIPHETLEAMPQGLK